jgi:hypothetical protein
VKHYLHDLVLSSSWPPKRNNLHHNADWLLYTQDLWRQTMCGIPSVFE